MNWLFLSGGQSIRVSFSASVFPMNIQDWFPLGLTGLMILLSKGLSRIFSNTTVWKYQFFSAQPSLRSNSYIHPYMITRKTIALTIQTFVCKVMFLLFNMLSRFVIAFLPRNKCLFISWLQSLSTVILEPKKIKSVTVSIFSLIYLPWRDETGCDAITLVFLMLSLNQLFHSPFSPSSRDSKEFLFTFCHLGGIICISLSAIWVVTSAYLRLLIFLPAILIPACAFPPWHFAWCSLHRSSISRVTRPWCTPFPILNQSIFPCPVLTVASRPAYRFFRRQVR